jgi:hypothetical protein
VKTVAIEERFEMIDRNSNASLAKRKKRNPKSMGPYKGNRFTEIDRLEKQHPGRTIVLNARTMEVLAMSKSDAVIARKVKNLDKNVVPLFIGCSNPAGELAFHHFCKTSKQP